MRSVQTAYLLHTRGKGKAAAVLLRQRPADSAIMPAMWELPEILRPDEDDEPVMIVRHSITYTNYYVRIYAADPENIPAGVSCQAGNWHKLAALEKVALTGLARKVLRRMGLLKLDTSLPRRRIPLPDENWF